MSEKRSNSTLKTGFQHFRLSDKNVSPLFYAANNGSIAFQFETVKAKKIWNISGSLTLGSNQSKRHGKREVIVPGHTSVLGEADSSVYEINPSLSFISAGLAYSFLFKLNTDLFETYLGGKIEDDFLFSGMGGDTWFFNQLSIMPSCRIVLIDRNALVLNSELSFPILSFLLRQPYSLDPSLPVNSYFLAYLKTGSYLSTINHFQQVNFNFSLGHKLSGGNAIGLTYQFMWMNYTNFPDRNLKAYSNSILLTYTF